ncbi:MAG: di-trans,poly-cis-decaprenylcistransferase [Gammaproteobacteria bacterium]|jgi:undecaprenyl diphosphate synthase|nr:di-trans,poly-cis-decaprenylcistransferase [Gammaproteobacteria bacterium]MDC2971676.1 polyprenyl diphosphate synthase [Gammaproteobacteria bacterium]URQ71108.1 polyprenyl diphosphate synthase [SAR86 cluster bacterium]|tara:strand:+ start:3533 stop:4213 length:681 start_codon:yes stop_codon:yes gene_type:complete
MNIGIIMDGNGRWAKRNSFNITKGHEQGINVVREIVEESVKQKISSLTLYAFSTENWLRPETEITGIKKLIIKAIDNQLTELLEQNVKLQFFGNISGFGKKVSSKISDAEKKTSFDDPSLVLNIALGYGGRLDIINAVNKILGESKNKNVIIDEEKFFSYLDAPLKDLDLLIRTGGEMRLSNFLLFHIAYTELFFTEKLWPDFTKEDYVNCIDSFSSRDRRFGKRV